MRTVLHRTEVCRQARWSVRLAFMSGFSSTKQVGVFLLPLGWDASPSKATPNITFSSTYLYTWMERGTVKVKRLAQGCSAMSPARAQKKTTHLRDEHTNQRTSHGGTAPKLIELTLL